MGKPIKSLLNMNWAQISSIEEFQNNFRIADVQRFYEDGSFLRWLKANGFTEYEKKVEKIKSGKPINELMKIFEIDINSLSETERAIYKCSMSLCSMEEQYNLGLKYLQGNDSKKNKELALYLIITAAEQGFAEAQNKLGGMYYDGNEIPIDNQKAFEWYTKSGTAAR